MKSFGRRRRFARPVGAGVCCLVAALCTSRWLSAPLSFAWPTTAPPGAKTVIRCARTSGIASVENAGEAAQALQDPEVLACFLQRDGRRGELDKQWAEAVGALVQPFDVTVLVLP
eukprot:TRINITY_DN33971_c0_g1_i1.p1 TRINITY_DN33971_c0_g1~~TRINITY_DN33971_c0_g1_i1.p1  ORF type:complete len:115 (-),score=10.74 TRINITY_DN33971_c0_g1_i1:125-469(-)